MKLAQHQYGNGIYILENHFLGSILTDFCQEGVCGSTLIDSVRSIYQMLCMYSCNTFLPLKRVEVQTRMHQKHGQAANLVADIVDKNTSVVIAGLARAGIIPSQVFYEFCLKVLNSRNIRQDFFYVNRKVNEKNEVIGVDFSGSKIGGEVKGSFVFLPDPMGATGGSIVKVVEYYKRKYDCSGTKFIAVHLIVTPEYLRYVKEAAPEIEVMTLRVDRGLSKHNKVLSSVLGRYKEEEKGLDENQYIVPGAGGVGEILYNSHV